MVLDGWLRGWCIRRSGAGRRGIWSQAAVVAGGQRAESHDLGQAAERLEDRSLLSVFMVLNTNSSGAGSLRQAIIDANAASGTDTVAFNIPAGDAGHLYYRNDGEAGQVSVAMTAGTTATDDSTIADIDPDYAHSWYLIQPTSQLPTITGAIIIDGYTQGQATSDLSDDASANTLAAGNNAVLRVELNGALAGTSANGLAITAGSSTIRGLVVNGFRDTNHGPGVGILLSTQGNNIVQGNFLGTDVSGTVAKANTREGVQVTQSSNNLIGGTSPGDRNLISGNTGDGIALVSTSSLQANNNLVQGNFIGTDRTGTRALGNLGSAGVEIRGSSGMGADNVFGGTTPGAGNVISGNQGDGIQAISRRGTRTVIRGNFIGTDVTGTQDLGNGSNGLDFDNSDSRIGGVDADDGALDGIVQARNVISGNGQAGISFRAGADGTRIQGNFIGTDVTGTVDLGNSDEGIDASTPLNIVIGGVDSGAGNLISGNNLDGINASAGLIQGNLIGTDVTGMLALGNSTGVRIPFANSGPSFNIQIGGVDADDGLFDGVVHARNVISGNGRGIDIDGNWPGVRVVQGNLIGTNITGTGALGNGAQGVLVGGNAGTSIGGTAAGAGNTIAFNGTSGIHINGSSNNTVQANSIFSNVGSGILLSSSTAKRDAILSNSVYSNGGLGIDLPVGLALGRTLNDANDADTGANDLQNFPVIASAVSSTSSTTIAGSLNSNSNSIFRLEFFSSPTADATGYGEGQTFLRSIEVNTGTANAPTDSSYTFSSDSNNVSFTVTIPVAVPVGHVITATATDITVVDHDNNASTATVPQNNTSEFSLARAVVQGNQAPVSNADSFTVAEGGTLNQMDGRGTTTPGSATDNGVLANDTDADGNTLTAILVSGPTHAGSFTLNSDGSFSYVHDGTETSSDSFTYRANDGTVDGEVATATITVTEVNDPPTAFEDSITVSENSSNNLVVVLTNDVPGPAEESSQSLSVTAASALHGSVTISTTGTLLYSPEPNYDGPDTITYTIQDNGTTNGLADPLSATGIVNVTVVPVVERRFDFNHLNSPTQTPVRSDAHSGGYIGVTKDDIYTVQRGYGWSAPVNSEDVLARAATNGALRRDVHLGVQGLTGARTFHVDLPVGGVYFVNLTLGHPVAAIQGARVQIESTTVLSNFFTQAGQFRVEGFQVAVTDGVLDIRISSDNIGSNWSIAGLEILPQSAVTNAAHFTAITIQGGTATAIPLLLTLSADGTSVDTVSGSVSAALADTLLTVSSTLGTITTTDADSSLQGVQIRANGTDFSFHIRRPIAAGSPTITVAAVNGGTASSSEVLSYVLPTGAAKLFDFGTPTSPSQDGYAQVDQYDAYSSMRGYGWVGLGPSSIDRGLAIGSTFSRLLRDANLSTSRREFRVDVAAGTYDVTLTIGDATAITDLDVTFIAGTIVNGLENVTNVVTSGHQYTHRTVRVESAARDGGQHAIELSIAATGTPWVLNGLTLRPAAVVEGNALTITPPGASRTADGTSLDTFTITGSDIDKLYTISTTHGTIVSVDGDLSPDQDVFYEGIQVTGTGAPIAVRVRRPSTSGTATFRVDEVTGAEHGATSQVYVLPPVRRFDFGTNTSPVANGFTQIKQSTTFTAALGYGWLSNPNTYDRGGAVGVTVPNLYRDGVLVGLATFRVAATPGTFFDLQFYTGDSLTNGNRLSVAVENNAFVATSNLLGLNQYETLVLQDVQDMNGDGFLTIAFTKGTPSSGLGFVLGFDIATDGNLPTPTTLAASETGSGGASIDLGTVQSLASAAIQRWSDAGLSRAAVDHLRTIEFRVQDLSGSLLGVADGNVVLIDSNAAGHGWFVDSTPLDDTEFCSDLAAASGPAAGRIDLLSVLMHELGHTLGIDHDHSGDDLMSALLSTGQRRLADVDDVFTANDVWEHIN